jgi:hypothetical protein
VKERTMARPTPPSTPSHSEPLEEVVIDVPADDGQEQRKTIIPGWMISAGVHGLAITIMALAVTTTMDEPEVELAPIRIAVLPTTPPKTPDRPIDHQPSEIPITITETAEVSQPVSPLPEVEPLTQVEAEEPLEGSEGDPSAVSTVELKSTAAFIVTGAGSNAASLFGNRTPGGKRRAIGKHGDGGRVESVESALRWFRRHQSPNGMWDVDQYQANCDDANPKCEPGKNQTGDADVACTGYALMCFLGAGYDNLTPNRYRPTVVKGLDWLLAQQKADGLIGERNYEHAVATMALAEAYGLSRDERLRGPAQKAVDLMLARQAKDPDAKDKAYAGLGWDYVEGNAARNDSSVTGWNLMALKSALGAGLDVRSGLEGGKVWLERTWKARNPEWRKLDPYTGESFFPYTFDAITDKVGGNSSGDGHLSCVGAVCAVFLGHHAGDPMLETMSNYIMNHDFPQTYPTNTYFLYYNTMAIFQVGGPRWDKWNLHVAKLLASAQRNDDSCFNGSWDFAGTAFHGHDTGRLLSTAYACLSQEVIWRYQQVGVQ